MHMNCENGQVEVVIKSRNAEYGSSFKKENPYGDFRFTAWIRVLEDGVFSGLYIDEHGIEKRDDIWARIYADTEWGIKHKVRKALRKNRRFKLAGGTTDTKTYRLCR